MPVRYRGEQRFHGLAKNALFGNLPKNAELHYSEQHGKTYKFAQGDGPPLFIKVVPAKTSLSESTQDRFRGSHAFREYDKILQLLEKGVSVPEPIAAAESRVGLRKLAGSVLITKAVSGRGIEEVIKELPPAKKQVILHDLADFIGDMHSKGVVHGGLRLKHIFAQEKPSGGFSFSLIDLSRARLGAPSERELIGEFYRLEHSLRNWKDAGSITQRDKIRFWKRYRKISGKLPPSELRIIDKIVKKADNRENKSQRTKNR